MVKIARNSPSLVATEIVRCLVALIDVSDEEFLAHESVCVSISELAGSFHGGLDDEYREALMELLFNVAATTKVRRMLLSLWFNLDAVRRDGQSISDLSQDTVRFLERITLFCCGVLFVRQGPLEMELLTVERLSHLLCIIGECPCRRTDRRFR